MFIVDIVYCLVCLCCVLLHLREFDVSSVRVSYILLVSFLSFEDALWCGLIDTFCCLDDVDIVWCSVFLS